MAFGSLLKAITPDFIRYANDLAVGSMKDNMVGITDVAPSAEEAAPKTYEYKDFQFDGDTFWQEFMDSERSRLGIEIGDDGFAVLPESISGAPLNEAEKNDWNRYLESFKGAQGAMMRRGANTYTPAEIRQVLSERNQGSGDRGNEPATSSGDDSSSRHSPTKRYNTRRYGKERGASRIKSDRERMSRSTRDRQDRQRSSMSRY